MEINSQDSLVDEKLVKKAALAAQVRMLYGQSPLVLSMSFILVCLIAIVIGRVTDWVPVLIWWLIMVTLFCAQLTSYILFNKREFSANHVFWYRLVLAYHLAAGLGWGIGLLWIINNTPTSYHNFLYIAIMSLSAAAIMLSVRMMVYYVYQLSLLLPLIIWLIVSAQPDHLTIVVFLIMTVFAIWVFAKQINGLLNNTFKLNLENHTLASSLKHSNARLKVLNEELAAISATDSLTQVANRRFFDEMFKKEFQRCTREELPISLILIDVDYFKSYNDLLGHVAGDEALVLIARFISDKIKRPTDLVARYGGEEFAVLLTNTSAKGAMSVAEEIRKGVENGKITHPGSLVSDYVTVSLGISSVIPNEDVSRDALFTGADTALYLSKEEGRNTLKYQPC